MVEVHPADPSVQPPCTLHQYRVNQQGDYLVMVCTRCTFTLSNHAGVDECLYMEWSDNKSAEFKAMTPLERLKATLEEDTCPRLTDVRCPHCHAPFCSDHLDPHIRENHARA